MQGREGEGRRKKWCEAPCLFSPRDDYEVTVKEVDDIVSLVLEDKQQVYGCRLSGGGFGGSVVALLHKDALEKTKERVMVGELIKRKVWLKLYGVEVSRKLSGCTTGRRRKSTYFPFLPG